MLPAQFAHDEAMRVSHEHFVVIGYSTCTLRRRLRPADGSAAASISQSRETSRVACLGSPGRC